MLVYTSITNERLQTNLVTCHLFPVVMTSFNATASLSLERLVNMHLTICHTLFKTNFHINFNIKRFCLDRGCGTTAGWKTFHLLLGGKPQAHCTTNSMTSWPVSANTSKIKSISKFSRYITLDSHHSHNRSTVSHLQLSWSWTAYTMSFSEKIMPENPPLCFGLPSKAGVLLELIFRPFPQMPAWSDHCLKSYKRV